MGDFNTILEQITTFGLALIVAVLAILYFKERAKKHDVMADKREKKEMAQNDRWGELGYTTVRKAIDDDGEDKALNRESQEKITARFDMAKHTIMRNALLHSTAKRVLYFAYHNGGDDYQQNPFKRMSCETEVMTEDVPPIQNKYRDLFRTYMYTVYATLNNDKCVIIDDMESIKTSDPSFYVTMTQDAIKAFYAAPVKNERGNTFAFVAYCYSEPQIIKDIESMVRNTASRLEGLYFSKEQEKETRREREEKRNISKI